jgi:uncharacterized coiled-coil protein SlyX
MQENTEAKSSLFLDNSQSMLLKFFNDRKNSLEARIHELENIVHNQKSIIETLEHYSVSYPIKNKKLQDKIQMYQDTLEAEKKKRAPNEKIIQDLQLTISPLREKLTKDEEKLKRIIFDLGEAKSVVENAEQQIVRCKTKLSIPSYTFKSDKIPSSGFEALRDDINPKCKL